MNIQEFVNTYGLNKTILCSIFCGFFISMLYDIVLSITNYFNMRAWRNIDYEEILYKLSLTINNYDLTEEEFLIWHEVVFEYKEKLKRIEKRKKFFNKFKGGKNVNKK